MSEIQFKNKQEVVRMFYYEEDRVKVGSYLKELILKKYESLSAFYRKYLYLENKGEGYTEDDLQRIKNRFSAVLNGKNELQARYLPIITDILGVSCEEILSAGKCYAPTSTHITNYDVAFSEDPEVWEKYMKREDNLFLNCDEYCKSVIDYALEFKNYKFIKFLLEENFMWLVDPNKKGYYYHDFCAGTSVKSKYEYDEFFARREDNYYYIADAFTPWEIKTQDKLRTQTIALAIECGDYEILDSLRAREIPILSSYGCFGSRQEYFSDFINEDMNKAIAFSENENVLKYYTEEFTVPFDENEEYSYMFPFLDKVIEIMIANKRNDNAELLLRSAVKHNKDAFEKLDNAINTVFQMKKEHYDKQKEEALLQAKLLGQDTDRVSSWFPTEKSLRREILHDYKIDAENPVVSYHVYNELDKSRFKFATNLFYVNCPDSSPLKKLVNELNEWHDKIISLGGE